MVEGGKKEQPVSPTHLEKGQRVFLKYMGGKRIIGTVGATWHGENTVLVEIEINGQKKPHSFKRRNVMPLE